MLEQANDTANGVRGGAVGWVIFDNPAKLNAMSSNMAGQALDIVSGYETGPEIRVVILR